jgi:non-heme Fe2+,alpha-ketoglutarate-dependent halogenase
MSVEVPAQRLRRLHRLTGHLLITAPAAGAATLAAKDCVPAFVTAVAQLPTSSLLQKGLSAVQVAQFHKDGYVCPLPLFDSAAIQRLQGQALEMMARLEAVSPGTRVDRVNMWHKANRFCYELSRHPAILDYVESLLGPDFYQWGCHMFSKEPHDSAVVPWHQDAQYWPLTPQRTVTVWLAFWDADESNAALRVVKGSHKQGKLRHHTNTAPHLTLNQEADEDQVDPVNISSLNLKAGEMSLHHDGILHGSLANNSDRPRCGFAMRYCPTNVKCDLEVWPTFESMIARGVDAHRLNPEASVPTTHAAPPRMFPGSWEFP